MFTFIKRWFKEPMDPIDELIDYIGIDDVCFVNLIPGREDLTTSNNTIAIGFGKRVNTAQRTYESVAEIFVDEDFRIRGIRFPMSARAFNIRASERVEKRIMKLAQNVYRTNELRTTNTRLRTWLQLFFSFTPDIRYKEHVFVPKALNENYSRIHGIREKFRAIHKRMLKRGA